MDKWLVVGLGNPGPTYARHRHNVGAMALAELADRRRISLRRHKTHALVGQGRLSSDPGETSVVLAQPLSFMNQSGGPVSQVLTYFSVTPDHLVVIHDELDVPFGSVRLKFGGGEGGHNGLRSISAALGTRDYHRIRLGIGRPPGRQDPADFVLHDFSRVERPELSFLLPDAADAVESLVSEGLTATQQRFHSR